MTNGTQFVMILITVFFVAGCIALSIPSLAYSQEIPVTLKRDADSFEGKLDKPIDVLGIFKNPSDGFVDIHHQVNGKNVRGDIEMFALRTFDDKQYSNIIIIDYTAGQIIGDLHSKDDKISLLLSWHEIDGGFITGRTSTGIDGRKSAILVYDDKNDLQSCGCNFDDARYDNGFITDNNAYIIGYDNKIFTRPTE